METDEEHPYLKLLRLRQAKVGSTIDHYHKAPSFCPNHPTTQLVKMMVVVVRLCWAALSALKILIKSRATQLQEETDRQ